MSLEKIGGTFTAYCDFCNNDYETEETDFLGAVDAIKRIGWKVFKKMNEWFHKCDNCVLEENSDDFEDVE